MWYFSIVDQAEGGGHIHGCKNGSYFQRHWREEGKTESGPGKFKKSIYPSVSEASREVTNFTERKNPHTPINGVKDEILFLGVLIGVYFLFLRIIFLIFNFSISEKCHTS